MLAHSIELNESLSPEVFKIEIDCGTECRDLDYKVVLGLRLDLILSKVFSNQVDSVILR